MIAWITFMKLCVIIPLLLKPCLAVLAIRLKITRSTHGPVLHNLWTHCRMEGDRNLIWSEIVKMYGPQWSRAGGSGNTVETLSVRRRKSITERVTWGGGWRRVDVDRESNKGGGLVRETLFHCEVRQNRWTGRLISKRSTFLLRAPERNDVILCLWAAAKHFQLLVSPLLTHTLLCTSLTLCCHGHGVLCPWQPVASRPRSFLE